MALRCDNMKSLTLTIVTFKTCDSGEGDNKRNVTALVVDNQ